jgi:hypothetical protein
MKTREYIDDRSSIGLPDLRSKHPSSTGCTDSSRSIEDRKWAATGGVYLSKVEALTTHFLRRSFGFTHELLNLDHESKNGPETMDEFSLDLQSVN